MKKQLLFSACLGGMVLVSGNALALDGVVKDGSGNYVTDGFGECVSYGKLKHFHKKDGAGYCADEPKKVAAPAPKPAPPPPPPKPVIETITLGAHALFDTDKSDLRPEGIAELDDAAELIDDTGDFDQVAATNIGKVGGRTGL